MFLKNNGFTLLEVMIAIAVLAIAMGGILKAEQGALDTMTRAKRMNIVSMLANNKLVEAERETEGKQFSEVRDEVEGKFESPFQDYSWSRKIKEIHFPDLSASGPDQNQPEGTQKVDANAQQVVKLATSYLSQASREIVVSIKWKEKNEDQSYNVGEYWVDLNHAFSLSEQPQ